MGLFKPVALLKRWSLSCLATTKATDENEPQLAQFHGEHRWRDTHVQIKDPTTRWNPAGVFAISESYLSSAFTIVLYDHY